jgi:hypothetical protein
MGFVSASLKADSDREFYGAVVEAIRAAQSRAREALRREFE